MAERKKAFLYEDCLFTTFLLEDGPNEEQQKAVSELNAILQPMGGEVSLQKYNLTGTEWHVLSLRLCPKAAAEYSRRGAGRKMKEAKELVTVGMAREMLKERSAESIAAELGISRSTLFRRLKDLDDEAYI